MRDLHDRVAIAGEHVRPEWSEMREEHVRQRVLARASRGHARMRLSLAALALIALGVLATALIAGHWRGSAERDAARSSASVEETQTLLSLSDGSVALGLSSDARVEPLEVTPGRVVVRLVHGAARFQVSHIDHREFSVQAGSVEVTVLGTIFDVAMRRDGVEVRVERGRVRVDSPGGSRIVEAPARAVFDTRPPERTSKDAPQETAAMAASALPVESASPVESTSPAIEPVASAPLRSAPSPNARDWRSLARIGSYGPAYGALMQTGFAGARDEPTDLMLAADVARLSGHGDDAVDFLRKVLERHRSDSRAPLAAFTLGRVLLDQLGRPAEAAQAFATARALAPAGTLAQDALAREVESWSRAENAERARDRAEEYLRLFPNGQRRSAVRSYGGLE